MLKKSVIIANRHQTSISLEEEFYKELVRIADNQGLSINQLITKIDTQKKVKNLSSAIRIYILRYVKVESIPKKKL